MGCNQDLANGAAERPDLYTKYVELELETGWTMFQGESLQHRVIKGRLEKAEGREEVAA